MVHTQYDLNVILIVSEEVFFERDLVFHSISQGILGAVLSLGLFISFRILNIADMTTRGASSWGCDLCHFDSTRGEPHS